ncbi:alanyl-tRNA synthetase [Desulfatibacillum alkenivorans DSM 16219]|jgi:alanyl-tRNA synthetase|uniref:Alanine--tRNA ligase n=1 Tax=Desulfatibacillum alkenivorans DSM 16219 TaxID=1121393 RepID=A0A1M6GCT0_9BACT|nr:alanine--tRNA ligase [Desulfatibacillum alkenivorans]SHJ07747.1 alanyl-tRNA synthetase [Desulfatibacillum alkenivorans DSM 16219]
MTGNEVRSAFLEYFKKNDHRVVKSSSLVPQDDPTLLFTNAGMVQFKRTFLGEEKRDYTRAATSQKCVRAGGKHNDLENVGYTARHHTFFEMLGNFSFGDYFKELAVELSWDLLVNKFGLPADKLWVSIYLDDDEAGLLWRDKIGVPEERIVRLGEKDNFWSMGDTGPCGPCSEIHIDRGEAFGCDSPDCAVGCDCDRYLEIWNLVFMQYNRDETGKMTPLPRPSIDTGMGLERICSILQNADTNYGTDLFTPIFNRIGELSGKKLGDSKTDDVCMKVIADHSRAAAFLVGDGILPSNEGRGYVLRRIMRRAIRYGRQLGFNKSFLHETVAAVCDSMGGAYPDLVEGRSFITNVIVNEESRFSETLDKGLSVLNDALGEMEAKGEKEISGEVIFKLYDTYGFPVDIVEDVVRDKGIVLDRDGFQTRMKEQKEKSRSTVAFEGAGEAFASLSSQGIKCEFQGYHGTSGCSKVILVVKDGKEVQEAQAGDAVSVVTEATPFYGESGGQMGDLGVIMADGLEMEVARTLKDPTGLIIHEGKVVKGKIAKGQDVDLKVDEAARQATARNHTATHLLHAALREVVGDHVKQAGSLVGPERLRFDFTHFSPLTPEETAKIETLVNERIRDNLDVNTVEMDADQARESGAMALFEEKYGDTVRVVSMEGFSKELCGGTHTERSGDVGFFVIAGETSVAAGVRRIEALTGAAAVEYVHGLMSHLNKVSGLLKEKPETLPDKIEKLLALNKQQEKEINALKAKIAAKASESVDDEIREVRGAKMIAKKVEVDSPAAMRDLADKFRDKLQSGIVVLGSEVNGKALLIVMVTKDLTKQFQAGNIIKHVAKEVGGGGGGRPDMAQAGGSKPENLSQAMEKAYQIVEEM